MSTDDPDTDDLAERFPRVAELEQALEDSDVDVGDIDVDDIAQRTGATRRDVLTGSAGLLGLGALLTGGSGTASAGNDQAGVVGSQAAPLDGYVEDLFDKNGNRVAELPGDGSLNVLQELSSQSVSTGTSLTDPAGVTHTGELADIDDVGGGSGSYPSEVRNAADFAGTTGGDQIQAAINDLPSNGGVVVVGSNGPDDVSGSTGSLSPRDTAAWEVTSAITIPANVVVVLVNSYVFLSDGTDDNIFRNANATSGDSTRDGHIAIKGEGHAIVDGNGVNQTDSLAFDRWQECGILFSKVDDFAIEDITVRNTNSWAVVPENATDGDIDVTFALDGNAENQDGIHVIGPSKDIRGHGVGTAGDDGFVWNATDSPEQGIGTGGTVEGVVLSGNIRSTGGGSYLRFAPSDTGGKDLIGCSFAGGSYDPAGTSQPPIRFGGDDGASVRRYKGVTIGDVTIRNAGDLSAVVIAVQPIKGLELSNMTIVGSPTTFIDLAGSIMLECDYTNIYMRQHDGETAAGTHALLALYDGVIADCSFDFNLRDGSGVQTAFAIEGDVVAKRIDADLQINKFDTGINVESGADVEKVDIDAEFESVTTETNINSEPVLLNGSGEESGTTGTPTLAWPQGAHVYTDGLYFRRRNDSWTGPL